MSDVMSDKDEECKGCSDEGQSHGAWPCTYCVRSIGGNRTDYYKKDKDSPVSSELNKAFRNV